jgi:DNA ligase D-like protein (predicted ligase)/DNA ligase D-like protein (predicted 3'-phosphoesterase)
MRQYYKPMLAQSAEAPFSSKDWLFEIKWDGIRALSYVDDELSIRSRNGNELKYNFPELRELEKLANRIVLDGEIVVMIKSMPDFQTLMERAKATSPRDIEYEAQKYPATYVVFDVLEIGGKPLLDLPLTKRKRLLKEYVKEGKNVVLSVFVEDKGEAYYEAAIKKRLEGIMAKKMDSPYEPGRRSGNWLKIKELQSCDCVICGYTKGEGVRGESFGALVLGLYSQGKLVYVGKVGTGFSNTDIDSLMKAFKGLETKAKTLQGVDIPEEITWLKPELVCEVMYQAVTKDKKLRMPRFRGVRIDKAPEECTKSQIKHKKLQAYLLRRDFSKTLEPRPESERGNDKMKGEGKIYIVQEHQARRLHYDLRLEKDGVLKSWAVPKGLPEVAGDKRLAIEVEDHPLEYAGFEGEIPKGEYGAGTVKIWDKGSYEPILWNENMIEVFVEGDKLHGRYVLTRFRKAGEKQWLILKARDKNG